MFAAAMIFAVPNLECSIYSTCKRISQKLLRNIDKFLHLIYVELGIPPYRVIRCNMEEIVLKGPHSDVDVRIVNSYPSKVTLSLSLYQNTHTHKREGGASHPSLLLSRRRRSFRHHHWERTLDMLLESDAEDDGVEGPS